MEINYVCGIMGKKMIYEEKESRQFAESIEYKFKLISVRTDPKSF